LGRSISREWDQAAPSFVKMPVREGDVSWMFFLTERGLWRF
jgi:hypothetical protein